MTLELLYDQKNPQSDEIFRYKYRLTRQTFFHLLKLLDVNREKIGLYPIEFQLIVTITFLASGCTFSDLEKMFGTPISTNHAIVHRVVELIIQLRKKVIKLPCQPEQEEISQEFKKVGKCDKFNNVAGCLDGTKIKISPPKKRQKPCYYRDYHHNYSLNCLAICDHKKRFIYTYVGYPGSVHDATIWQACPLFKKNDYPFFLYCLLADSGFPLSDKPLVLVPYKKRPKAKFLPPEEDRFNKVLSSMRKYIECSFGIMKQKFRILLNKIMEIDLDFSPKVIMACMVLHNICIDKEIDYDNYGNELENFVADEEYGNSQASCSDAETESETETEFTGAIECAEANKRRQMLTNYISRPKGGSHLSNHNYYEC